MSDEDLWLFKPSADQSDVDAVGDVIRRETWWVKGEEIERLEENLSDYVGRRFGVAFNSGTSALFAYLEALDVEDREVIVPSYTFAATPNAVELAGGRAVFADIEPETFGLDPEDVRRKITDDTAAVMPIHFGGNVSTGINEIREITETNDLVLIEDACHSLGSSKNGENVGTFGHSAMFSFCFNKIISTGEGGMIVTDDEEIVHELELLRSHGCDRSGDSKEYVQPGFNLRLSSIEAALGLSQLNRLDEFIRRRRERARTLNDGFTDLPGIEPVTPPDDTQHVYQLYNILLENQGKRDDLQSHLASREVPTRVTYSPMHEEPYYREKYGERIGSLPVTEDISQRILTLPFHPDLKEEHLDRILNSVSSWV